MSLTEAAFWLVFAGGTLAACVRPIAGVCLYVLVYHLNPEHQWWGANVAASGLRVALTVAAATVIGIVVRRPVLPPGGRQFSAPLAGLWLLVGLASLSLMWGYGLSERGVEQASKLAKIAIFVTLLVRCVRTAGEFHCVLLSWMLGVAYVGYQAHGGAGLMQGGRLATGVGGPDFDESAALAAHMLATLPLVGAALFVWRSWTGRFWALTVGALAVNTIVLTRSRGAVFGFFAMLMVLALSLPRGYRGRGLAGLAIAGALTVQLTDPGWWDRMRTISTYQQDASAIGRLAYWRAAVEMAVEHPLGIGFGNFQEVVREYVPGLSIIRSAHNTYLECLAELGAAGLLLLAATLGATFAQLSAIRRRARALPEWQPVQIGRLRSRVHLGWYAGALRAGLAAYLMCSVFETRLCGEDLWILVALATCLSNAQCAAAADAVHAPEPPAGEAPAPYPLAGAPA